MTYESLVRMVEYSQRMIEKIGKEVEDNFITRKELFQFSKFSQLKTCLDFQQPTQPFPAEEYFKRACGETLKKLWEMEPWLKGTKLTQIKRYIEVDRGHGYGLHRLGFEMYKIFNTCFTRIQILIPNGYEFWYVANFEKGLSASKWFRAESPEEDSARAGQNIIFWGKYFLGYPKNIFEKIIFYF